MLSLGLPFIMLGFLLFSCDSDKGDSNDDRSEMITPTMAVKGFFGTDPLQMYAGIYSFSGDLDLRLQLFQFYISDIGLIKTKSTRFRSRLKVINPAIDYYQKLFLVLPNTQHPSHRYPLLQSNTPQCGRYSLRTPGLFQPRLPYRL